MLFCRSAEYSVPLARLFRRCTARWQFGSRARPTGAAPRCQNFRNFIEIYAIVPRSAQSVLVNLHSSRAIPRDLVPPLLNRIKRRRNLGQKNERREKKIYTRTYNTFTFARLLIDRPRLAAWTKMRESTDNEFLRRRDRGSRRCALARTPTVINHKNREKTRCSWGLVNLTTSQTLYFIKRNENAVRTRS